MDPFLAPKVASRRPCTCKVPKTMAQYPTIGEHRQYRVHCFGAILPVVSCCGTLGHSFGHLGGPGFSEGSDSPLVRRPSEKSPKQMHLSRPLGGSITSGTHSSRCHLESQVAHNNRPLYCKVDHNQFKVAHGHWLSRYGYGPLAFQVDLELQGHLLFWTCPGVSVEVLPSTA